MIGDWPRYIVRAWLAGERQKNIFRFRAENDDGATRRASVLIGEWRAGNPGTPVGFGLFAERPAPEPHRFIGSVGRPPA